MYHQFNIRKLYALTTIYLCFCVYLRINSDLCQLLSNLDDSYNIDLTLYNQVVIIRTTSLILKTCTVCTHSIYKFCIYLKTSSDLCHLQKKLIGFVT